MTDQEVLQIYINFIPFLAQVCGTGCEIVIHDISNPEHSLVAIENNISNRELGSPLTDLTKDIIAQGNWQETDWLYNYKGYTKKREFLSSTFFIKNQNRLVGLLCINKDMTAVQTANTALTSLLEQFNLVRCENTEHSENLDKPLPSLMLEQISEIIMESGVAPARMSINEKIQIVHRLDEKGILKVKGAVPEIAEQLFVSVPTIYRYLKKKPDNLI